MVVRFDRDGPSGNIFAIVGAARVELQAAGRDEEADEMFRRIHFDAGSYENALEIVAEYVELEEILNE